MPVPTGLDGNPDPLRTPARDAVLDEVTRHVLDARGSRPLLVGVDGQAGSGKTTFADELAGRLRSAGVEVVRASIDSFHNPRRVRLPAGVDLAESYVERSHDLDALRRLLLEPFRSGGTYRAAAFDVGADRPVEAPALPVPPSSVLLLDGLFLHREELAGWWDLSILLLGPSRPTAEASRGLGGAPVGSAGLLHLAWWAALAHRYLDGWRRYEERCEPARVADLVVDNDDLAAPRILRRP